MTRILVLEEISPAGLEALREESSFEVEELYADDRDAIRASLANAEALVVRSKTKVTAELLQAANLLRVIGRPGTGVDNVDVPAATARGIVVMNTPAGNSISAAEHTMGLLLALARKIPQADASLKQGKWDRKRFMGTELHDKVLGIIGYGKIGSEFAKRAQAFKMRVLVFDPFVAGAVVADHNIALVTLEELLAQSDVVSLHAPLTPATRKVINADSLALMKEGALLINAARGDLVDEAALVGALKAGRLAGAALDVFAGEPSPNQELVALPNVVCTPHIGASTVEAQEKVGYDIAIQIRDYFRDGIARNAVNFPSVSLAEYKSVSPYLELGERLGSLLSQLSDGRMQEVTVRYYGDLTQVSTRIIGTSILVGIFKPILTERVTLVNALQICKERGIHFLETRSSRERSYSNLLSVKLMTDKGEEWAEGTVLHHSNLRLVSLYGIDIEAPLDGDMLVIRNIDTPGVIGRVGTILGNNRINIASFALGREVNLQNAVGVVSVDSAIPQSVLEEIRALPQVLRVQVVHV